MQRQFVSVLAWLLGAQNSQKDVFLKIGSPFLVCSCILGWVSYILAVLAHWYPAGSAVAEKAARGGGWRNGRPAWASWGIAEPGSLCPSAGYLNLSADLSRFPRLSLFKNVDSVGLELFCLLDSPHAFLIESKMVDQVQQYRFFFLFLAQACFTVGQILNCF